jgi:hypothetical protein
MKSRAWLFAALAFFLFTPLFADDAGILVPREVFIGDTAEFSFRTERVKSLPDESALFIVPSGDIPVSPDLTINSITAVRDGEAVVVTIRFVPWVSGVLRFPSISIGKSVVNPPPVRIGSLVEKTGKTTLQPPRSPLLVPGTTWILFALVALVLTLFIVFLVAGFKIRKFLSLFPVWRRSNRRLRFARKELRTLSRQLGKKSLSDWYAAYSVLYRRYLGSFCRDEASAFLPCTVSEIVSLVADRLALYQDAEKTGPLVDRLQATLTRVDLVRFSGVLSGDDRPADLSAAMEFFLALEAVQEIREEASDAQL